MTSKSKRNREKESKIQLKPQAKSVPLTQERKPASQTIALNPKVETAEKQFRDKKKDYYTSQKSTKS